MPLLLSRAYPAIVVFLVLSGLGLSAYGLWSNGLFQTVAWSTKSVREYAYASVVIVAICGFARSHRVAAGALLLLVLWVGKPAGTMAVALLALAALSLGSWLGRTLLRQVDNWTTRWALALLLGLAGLYSLFSPLAHTSWNSPPLYAALLSLCCMLFRHDLAARCAELRLALAGAWEANWRQRAVLALLLLVLLLCGSSAFAPLVSADDMATHLKMAHELYGRGQASFDYRLNVWAVAPYAVDLLHSIPFVASGGEARAMNVLQLLLYANSMVLLFTLLRRTASFGIASLVTATYASVPYVHTMNSVMQTELLSVNLVLASLHVLLVLRATARVPDWRQAGAFAVLLGFFAALKLTNLFFVAGFGLLLLQRYHLAWGAFGRQLPFLVLAFLAVGAQSYTYAFAATGSPLFPLFNAWFKSPYFDTAANFTNPIWQGHVTWDMLYRMAIHTSTFTEERPGTAGFQLLVLVPSILLVSLVSWRQRGYALFAAVVFLAGVVPAQQYLRYFLPVFPILAWLSLGLFEQPLGRFCRGVVVVASGTVILANLYFLPVASWHLSPQQLLGRGIFDSKRSQFVEAVFPESTANAYLNAAVGKEARVLYAQGRLGSGTLIGTALHPDWTNPALVHRVYPDSFSVGELAKIAKDYGVTHVVMPPGDIDTPRRPIFEAFVHQYGRRIPLASRSSLYELSEELTWGEVALPNIDFAQGTQTWLTAGKPVVAGRSVSVTAADRVEQLFAVNPGDKLRLAFAWLCEGGGADAIVKFNWYRNGRAHQTQSERLPCGPVESQGSIRAIVPAKTEQAGLELLAGSGVRARISHLSLRRYRSMLEHFP